MLIILSNCYLNIFIKIIFSFSENHMIENDKTNILFHFNSLDFTIRNIYKNFIKKMDNLIIIYHLNIN
jgi:hypothetical protein